MVIYMIIPIFIPHEGCKNDCAFCNQRHISGKDKAPSIKDTEEIINEYLSYQNGFAEQIAFFGGSFTGIDISKQNEYLSLAKKYIENGNVKSIRLSTRPDYIDEDTVKRLKDFGVKNIELGAQSMDDEVLLLSNRGHTKRDVCVASEIINKHNVTLGLQMMTGLMGDSKEKCISTAHEFVALGAKETRIYPTIVLKNTMLEKLYHSSKYTPQTVEEAVNTCADLYKYFTRNKVEILRIGLYDSPSLKENYVAGPYHASFGEIVKSRVIRREIEKSLISDVVSVRANKKYISKIKGNKCENIAYFKERNITVNVIEDNSIDSFIIEKGM